MPSYAKQYAIAAFVTTALSSATCAYADSTLLFPYITTSSSAYTFITLIHRRKPPSGQMWAERDNYHRFFRVHAQTRSLSAVDDCGSAVKPQSVHIDDRPGTLMQWEVGNRFNLPADFGDRVPAPDLRIPANHQGYLLVEYGGYYSSGGASPTISRMYGEATIVDTATGMTLSYSALHAPKAGADFTYYGGKEYATSWFPQGVVGTSWYMLSVGKVTSDGYTLRQHLSETYVTVNPSRNDVYGRNGQAFSFPVNSRTIRCFATLTMNDLVPDPFAAAGGWLTMTTTSPVIIGKIQQSGELGIPVATMHPLNALDYD